jgi:hypothetical protein
MVRKATLGDKAARELRARIDCALLPETRRRLSPWEVDFLISIRSQLAASVVRLSKKQRDATEEVLAKAFSDEPVVVLEGRSLVDLANLIRHATGDVRVSALGEHVLLRLNSRLNDLAMADGEEPSLAVSPKQWRILEDIKQRTYFGQSGEPPPIDPDGLMENEDPDRLPQGRDAPEFDYILD